MKTCGHDSPTIDTGSVRLCQECAKLPMYARTVRAMRRRVGTVMNESRAKQIVEAISAGVVSNSLIEKANDIAISALEELELGNVAIAKRLGSIALKARHALRNAGID